MNKSQKQAVRLKARQDAFVDRMPSGQQCHRPGSQNTKKGYGKGRKG